MDSEHATRTSTTLLGRLRLFPNDQDAWAEFVDRYGSTIYGWCRRWRLQDADARDLTQIVLVKLAVKMRDFSYDRTKSFRGWLRTLAQHALADYMARRNRARLETSDGAVAQHLESLEARRELVAELEEEFDQELLAEAVTRVRLRVESRTWQAFQLTAIERQSGAAVAQRLAMKVATVYRARCKVQKMLQEELRKLDGV